MEALLIVAGKLITLFIYVIVGFVIIRTKIVSEAFCKGISGFLINVTVPCLIISTFQTDYDTQRLIQAGLVFAISMVIFGASILVGRLTARLFKIPKPQEAVWTYAVTFPNHAFMGWPVMAAVFGSEAVFYATFANMAFSAYAYTWGVHVMRSTGTQKDLPHSIKSDLITPVNIGILLGLTFFITQLRLPTSIGTAVDGMSALTTPLAMIYVGTILGGCRLSEVLKDTTVYKLSFVRLILVPALVFILARPLPLTPLVYGVLVIGHSMPVAGYCAIYAGTYGNDALLASKLISVTTLLCVLTIPIWAMML